MKNFTLVNLKKFGKNHVKIIKKFNIDNIKYDIT